MVQLLKEHLIILDIKTKNIISLLFLSGLMLSFRSFETEVSLCKIELLVIDKNTNQDVICSKKYHLINQLHIADTILSCPSRIKKVNHLYYYYNSKFNDDYSLVELLQANHLKILNFANNPINFDELTNQIYRIKSLTVESDSILIDDFKYNLQIEQIRLYSNNLNYIPKHFSLFSNLNHLRIHTPNGVYLDSNFKDLKIKSLKINIIDDSVVFYHLNSNSTIEELIIENELIPKNFMIKNNIKRCIIIKSDKYNMLNTIDSLNKEYPNVSFHIGR
jgi:hypothetical protein